GGDTDMTPDEVYKAVWERDKMPVPYAKKDNPTWKPSSVLTNHGVWLRKISAQLDAQDATIAKLVGIVAAQNTAIDADALITQIREELGKVVVRLDVAP